MGCPHTHHPPTSAFGQAVPPAPQYVPHPPLRYFNADTPVLTLPTTSGRTFAPPSCGHPSLPSRPCPSLLSYFSSAPTSLSPMQLRLRSVLCPRSPYSSPLLSAKTSSMALLVPLTKISCQRKSYGLSGKHASKPTWMDSSLSFPVAMLSWASADFSFRRPEATSGHCSRSCVGLLYSTP